MTLIAGQKTSKHSMLWLLPLITAVWILGSFIITYVIAVANGRVEPNFPYISYTAIYAPERAIFSQLVNIGAVLLGSTAYVRYIQVKADYPHMSTKMRGCNVASLVLGMLSALGLSMVANFQAKIIQIPHYLGAFFAFGLGTVYCWVQTVITGKIFTRDFNYSRGVLILRIFISISVTIILFIFTATKIFYKKHKFPGSKWNVHRGVYLTSTSTEWLLAICILLYVLSFIAEFRNIRLRFPEIVSTVERSNTMETNHQLSWTDAFPVS